MQQVGAGCTKSLQCMLCLCAQQNADVHQSYERYVHGSTKTGHNAWCRKQDTAHQCGCEGVVPQQVCVKDAGRVVGSLGVGEQITQPRCVPECTRSCVAARRG